jgi:hypothetical protein
MRLKSEEHKRAEGTILALVTQLKGKSEDEFSLRSRLEAGTRTIHKLSEELKDKEAEIACIANELYARNDEVKGLAKSSASKKRTQSSSEQRSTTSYTLTVRASSSHEGMGQRTEIQADRVCARNTTLDHQEAGLTDYETEVSAQGSKSLAEE